MSTDIEDLEQECEDALFELCDVRERYPAKCANELEQCLHLTRRINMKPPRRNVIEKLIDISITDEQTKLFQEVWEVNKDKCRKQKRRNHRLEKILSSFDDLKTVMEQIKNAELCPINTVTKSRLHI